MRLTSKNSPNLNVDYKFFDIMNKEQYWLLGLLMADGCISGNRIILQLTGEDLEVINKVRKLIKHVGNVSYISKSNSHRLSFRNKILVDKLYNIGCTENKSLTLKCPYIEDKPMIRHFIRGYFEGDGSITFNNNRNYIKCSILGTEEFLTSLKKYIHEEIGINCNIYKRGSLKTLSLEISGNIQSVLFLNWIYSGDISHILMERKRNKFKLLYNKMISNRKTNFNLDIQI